ncbi:MAG: glycosyltransferase involved in cell wall biosynthesis [Parvicellaceae bacterium]|jgi:glycosyltransferase involved in cell wall biosynthesis
MGNWYESRFRWRVDRGSMMESPTYSVVIPTYNSSPFIQETITSISSSFVKQNLDFEIIIVDDYSKDNTWEQINTLINEIPNVKIKGIRLSKNFGQHKATMCGFSKAEGDFIITMDDDLESNPDAISSLINMQREKKADLVYAHYTGLKRGALRKVMFGIFRAMAKLFGGKNRVNGSSFRLLKKSLAISATKNANSFAFMDELFLWNTEQIEFVDVEHRDGLRKNSNYSVGGLVNSSAELILFSSDLPLKLIKYLGLSVAAVNIVIGMFYVYKKLMGKFDEPGYASIIVSILFSTGLILFAIGVIGEYLNKVFKSLQNAPLYSIDQET